VVFSWIRKVHRSCHHPCIVTSAEHCCHELLAASRYCQPRQYNFAVQLCLVCHQFSVWTFQHCDFLVLRCTAREVVAYEQVERPFHTAPVNFIVANLGVSCIRFHSPGFFIGLTAACTLPPLIFIFAAYGWAEFEGGPLAAPGVHNRYSNPTVAADFRYFKSILTCLGKEITSVKQPLFIWARLAFTYPRSVYRWEWRIPRGRPLLHVCLGLLGEDRLWIPKAFLSRLMHRHLPSLNMKPKHRSLTLEHTVPASSRPCAWETVRDNSKSSLNPIKSQ